MNVTNQILNGIYMWLRELGYRPVLNLTYSPHRTSYGASPNIIMESPCSMLRLVDGNVVLYIKGSPTGGWTPHKFELFNPRLLDDLYEKIRSINAQDPAGEDNVLGSTALPGS